MKLTAPAPGKVNLSLLVGAPRADGLHPLVSVVQAVSLADELTLEPATGDADEVVCPGVEGPNLAARALELFREATGWDAPPQRIHIDKRVPVAAGMGGGSADAAAALRLAAHAAGGAPAGLLHELAVRLGADVPSQLEPGRVLMTGAGERVDRLPDPEPFGLVIVPLPHALSTPDVYAAFDRLSTPRTPDELDRARAAALAGEPPPPVNDLQDAARELCPAIDDALFGGAMVSGSGPTVFATYPTIAAARRGGAGDPRRDRRPPGAPRLRGGGGRVKWSWLLGAAALVAFLIVRRRSLGRLTQAAGWIVAAAAGLVGFGVIQLPNLEELMLDVGQGARAVDVPGGRRAGVPRDRRLHRPRRARGDHRHRRRRRRRPGRDLVVGADRHHLDLRGRGRSRLLHRRPQARPRLAPAPRPAREDHRGAPGAGRAVLREARRRDDPGRPLHRLRARAGAVHRRHEPDAAASLPSLRRARRGRLGGDLRHARLRLLALVRPAHDLRVARAVRVRHRRRGHSCDRHARPAAP